jgi:hypothetical protein
VAGFRFSERGPARIQPQVFTLLGSSTFIVGKSFFEKSLQKTPLLVAAVCDRRHFPNELRSFGAHRYRSFAEISFLSILAVAKRPWKLARDNVPG